MLFRSLSFSLFILLLPSLVFAGDIQHKQSLGLQTTILSATVSIAAGEPYFNLTNEYSFSSSESTLSQHQGLTPNGTYDCSRYRCLKVTVDKEVVKSVMNMDFIDTQPYAMLNLYRAKHAAISQPTAPLVDVSASNDSYTFYFPSLYGYCNCRVDFVPTSGRDR